MVSKHHKCSSLSFPLILKNNKNSSLYYPQSTVYILCTVYILDLKPLVLPSTVVWITRTGCSKSNCTMIILRSQGDTALFTALFITNLIVYPWTKGFQILPCEFPHLRNRFLWLDMWRQERSTHTLAAGTTNKPIHFLNFVLYWRCQFLRLFGIFDR